MGRMTVGWGFSGWPLRMEEQTEAAWDVGGVETWKEHLEKFELTWVERGADWWERLELIERSSEASKWLVFGSLKLNCWPSTVRLNDGWMAGDSPYCTLNLESLDTRQGCGRGIEIPRDWGSGPSAMGFTSWSSVAASSFAIRFDLGPPEVTWSCSRFHIWAIQPPVPFLLCEDRWTWYSKWNHECQWGSISTWNRKIWRLLSGAFSSSSALRCFELLSSDSDSYTIFHLGGMLDPKEREKPGGKESFFFATAF